MNEIMNLDQIKEAVEARSQEFVIRHKGTYDRDDVRRALVLLNCTCEGIDPNLSLISKELKKESIEFGKIEEAKSSAIYLMNSQTKTSTTAQKIGEGVIARQIRTSNLAMNVKFGDINFLCKGIYGIVSVIVYSSDSEKIIGCDVGMLPLGEEHEAAVYRNDENKTVDEALEGENVVEVEFRDLKDMKAEIDRKINKNKLIEVKKTAEKDMKKKFVEIETEKLLERLYSEGPSDLAKIAKSKVLKPFIRFAARRALLKHQKEKIYKDIDEKSQIIIDSIIERESLEYIYSNLIYNGLEPLRLIISNGYI